MCESEQTNQEFKGNFASLGLPQKSLFCFFSSPKMTSAHQDSDSDVDSHLYLLYRPMFPDWVKIGKARNPHTRLRELAVGCPHLILFKKFPGEASVERLIHRLLDNLRNKVQATDFECGGTEWIKMTPSEACSFIEAVICLRNAGLEHVLTLFPKIYG